MLFKVKKVCLYYLNMKLFPLHSGGKKKSLFDIIKEKGKRELHLGAKKTETPA